MKPRSARRDRRERGFTLIELLMVILIIGILAVIAIPIFLHQKASAYDATVKAQLAFVAKATESALTDASSSVSISRSVDGTNVVAGVATQQVTTTAGITWNIAGTSGGYCVVGSRDGSKYTPTAPLVYDSTRGGLQPAGATCAGVSGVPPTFTSSAAAPAMLWGTTTADDAWGAPTPYTNASTELYKLAAGTGHRPGVFGIYMDFKYADFPTYEVNWVRNTLGAIPSISWEPQDMTKPANDPSQAAYDLNRIVDGSLDAYINHWATDAAAWGHPVIIRFAGEMNSDWQVWSPNGTARTPATYKAAYRHVHDLFVAAGATNVQWVFNAITVAGEPAAYPMESFYPGNDVVDWIAIDAFNWGRSKWGLWQSYSDIFGASFPRAKAMAPGKPLMIAETGSDVDWGTNLRSAWLTDAYTKARADGVRAFIQFDRYRPAAGEPDFRVWNSLGSADAEKAMLNDATAPLLSATNSTLSILEAYLLHPAP